ncbi:MAG: response regulator [Desulfobacteraceae bacterium]|nr:response regulator [Desulfobacteraceae bacterium]
MLKKQILAVDDDKNLLKNFRIELNKKDYEIHTCITGDKAVEIIDNEYLDIIFLDVHLPGSKIRDEKLVKYIKKSGKNENTPVIIMTGKTKMGASMNMMKYGCSDCILKDPKTFFDKVFSIIESYTGQSPVKYHTKIKQLASVLYNRKDNSLSSYTLILGAGASISSGCKSFKQIMDDILDKYVENGQYPSETSKDIIFDTELDNMHPDKQLDILRPYLKHSHISPGYKQLLDLVERKYFKRIITTNLDSILKELFQAHTIKYDELIVGLHEDEKIEEIWFKKDNKIKILKLHGDLDADIIAFTQKKIFQFNDTIQNILKRALNKNIIILGQQMRDFDIIRNINIKGGPIWYINPERPTGKILTAMDLRKSLDNVISGPYGRFDNFFEALNEEIKTLEI